MSEVVSIIIPVYNVKEYIDECIISIVNQTYSNLEIILIDDGSSDGSAEICDRWASKDSRIHVAHQGNRGVSAARNTGLFMSKGEFISFVDADDWLETDEIEKLVSHLISHEADMAVCGYINHSLKRNKTRACPPDQDCGFDEAVVHMINRITAV